MANEEIGSGNELLAQSLTKLTALLDQYFAFRAPLLALAEIERQIAAGNSSAVTELRAKFSGMGSLNDFYLQGNPLGSLTPDEQANVNERYRRAREDVYENLLRVIAD